MRKRLIKSLLTICMVLTMGMSVSAQEQMEDIDSNEEAVVELEDEQVPLGLDSKAVYDRYKRSVAVMLFFGSLIVVTTVGATVKEKYEKEKLN